MNAFDKLDELKKYIKSLESIAVAFSGGVDSSFLLKVASDVLVDKSIAVTAKSSTYPLREYKEAVEFHAGKSQTPWGCSKDRVNT